MTLHKVPENSFLIPLRFFETRGGRTYFVYRCTRCSQEEKETVKDKCSVTRGLTRSCGCLEKDTRKLNLAKGAGFQFKKRKGN